ncbi:MAG: hypothetical protein RIE08_01795 [Acidimicrobiales bacterium]
MSPSEPRPTVESRGYEPPEICDIDDLVGDREFSVVPAETGSPIPERN